MYWQIAQINLGPKQNEKLSKKTQNTEELFKKGEPVKDWTVSPVHELTYLTRKQSQWEIPLSTTFKEAKGYERN